jgi:hypothetical protein
LEKYEQEASGARAENLEKIVKAPIEVGRGLYGGYESLRKQHPRMPELRPPTSKELYEARKRYEPKIIEAGRKSGMWISRRFKPKPKPTDSYTPSAISTKLHAERNRQMEYEKEHDRVMQSLKTTGRPPTNPPSYIIVRKPGGRVVRDRLLGTSQPPMGRTGYGVKISHPLPKPTPEAIPVGKETPAKPSMFTRLKGMFIRKKEEV